jgi:hypothetical protein
MTFFRQPKGEEFLRVDVPTATSSSQILKIRSTTR